MDDLVVDESLPPPPARPSEGHKGTFGRALIIAGSQGMSGAAVLSGLGALRGGAGLVYVAVPASIQSLVAAAEPSYLVHGIADHGTGQFGHEGLGALEEIIEGKSAVAVGPGLGHGPTLPALISRLYASVVVPLVLDADGLNGLATLAPDWHAIVPAGPRVMTPHPGEFARLLNTTTADVQAHRQEYAVRFARERNVVLLLKGAGTVVTDGRRLTINPTGNPGMGTGGSGDVLTGLICALLAQGMPPYDAARLGAYLHGLAGDLAASELSEPGLIASDLPLYLARAWRTWLNRAGDPR